MSKNILRKIASKIYRGGCNYLLDLMATLRLCHVRMRKTSGRMRVGFIVQLPEIWDKQVSLYEEMLKRENIDCFLFVAPPYDFEKKELINNYKDNYFLNRYETAVKAVVDDQVVDLRDYHLDYVFFPRPYDGYLPKALRSTEVSKYAQCCYLPYGFSGSPVFDGGNTNRLFFRNISFVFLDSYDLQLQLTRKYPISSALKIRQYKMLGYPPLEPYMSPAPIPERCRSILWTPRWSYDPQLGGSHFIEYKDTFFIIKEKFPHLECTFRPHPLMFEELRRTGRLTEEQATAYLQKLEQTGIIYDHGEPIEKAIRNSDVLVTDFSSIVINYFLTGRPVIYCTSQIALNESYQKMCRYMYLAKNEEDILSFIDQLTSGDDPLRESRLEFIEKEFSLHRGSGKRIVDALAEDYQSRLK